MAHKDDLEDSLVGSKDCLLTRNAPELHSLANSYPLSYLVCQGKWTS